MESTTALSNDMETVPESARVQVYDLIINIVGFQILATFGVLVNVFILIVVRKNKNLQSSCFLLICGECMSSICLASGHIAVSVHEAAILTGAVNIVQPRSLCYMSMAFFCLVGVQSGNLMTNCVAMDRLLSILAPTFYRQMGNRYVKLSWVFCFAFAVFSPMAEILITSGRLTDPIECTNIGGSISRAYSAIHGTFNMIFSGLSVVLYGAMFVAFWWRKKTIKDPTAGQAFLKQQQTCMPTVKLLIIFYLITSVIPEFCLFIVVSFDFILAYLPRLTLYTVLLKAASPSAQIVALYFGSKRFKKCAKAVLGLESESTQPAPVTSGGNVRIAPRNAQVNMIRK